MGKFAFDGPFDYRSELNAIKEKLEILILIPDNDDNSLYEFKLMVNNDMTLLKDAIKDEENIITSESDKLNLYKSITAKYHSCIPNLGDGLYNYCNGFYDNVYNTSLIHNLNIIYHRLETYKLLGYTNTNTTTTPHMPIVQINNNNENNISIDISFNNVKDQIENMSALNTSDIQETLKKIDEIEAIIKSKDKKYKKWEKLKDIIIWIADKGVDVGTALLPLILQIN